MYAVFGIILGEVGGDVKGEDIEGDQGFEIEGANGVY